MPNHSKIGAPLSTRIMGPVDGHVPTAIFKMDNQQGPTVQHMELCSVLCGSLDGREFGGEWIHVCV